MLVKQSIVEKWYQTDSWVYKNFSYLFNNPLWSKHIPNGFSVCPYFWLSLFSLLIFKPFIVFPIEYGIKTPMRWIGKPASVVDKKLYNFWEYILRIEGVTYKSSLGFVTTGVLFVLASLTLIAAGIIGIGTYKFYSYLTLTPAGTFSFWSIASFVGLLIIIKIHKAITNTECKTMYYLFVWLALFMVGCAVFVPTECMLLLHGVFTNICKFIADIGAFLWWGLSIVANWAWIGIKYAALWAPIPAFVAPWWSYFVGLAALCWIVSKLDEYHHNKVVTQLLRSNPQELYAQYRQRWIDQMVDVLIVGDYWLTGKVFDVEFSAYTAMAAKPFRMELYRQAFEIMWKSQLDKLQLNYPILDVNTMKAIRNEEGNSYDRFQLYSNGLVNGNTIPDFSSGEFQGILLKLVNSDATIAKQAALYRQQTEAKMQTKSVNSWNHKTCLAVTTAISTMVHSIWNVIKMIGMQLATFAVYIWILIKAKKQGACPYFRFQAPQPPTAPIIPNNQKSVNN